MLAVLTGCAGSPKPVRSIPVVTSGDGVNLTTRTWNSSGRLHVAGTVTPPSGQHHPLSGHMDVILMTSHGRTIATAKDRIAPTHPLRKSRTSLPFHVSFPEQDAARADLILVDWHREPHPEN